MSNTLLWAVLDDHGDDIKAWRGEGNSITKILDKLAKLGTIINRAECRIIMVCLGLNPSVGARKYAPGEKNQRADVMADLYRNGQTLQQISTHFKITRERVRQLLKKHHHITAKDGGKTKIVADNRALQLAKRRGWYLENKGCTFEQYKNLLKRGREMLDSGISIYKTPGYAYSMQRNNALRRGIKWHFKLWDWWQVWEASGKWDQRGRGSGYVMARFNDEGPYSLDNVYIIPAIQNISTRKNKKSNLPCGVTLCGKNFTAKRQHNGHMHHLGTFTNMNAAQKAYLAFTPEVAASKFMELVE